MRISSLSVQVFQGFVVIFVATLLFSASAARAEVVDFELPDIKGAKHKLSEFRGKWVVVNYWATWCPPCLEELPELVIFHETHKDTDAVVIGVNFEDVDTTTLKKFIDNYSISYLVVRSKPGASSALGPIPGLPTSYLVNPSGEVVARQVGQITGKWIEKYMVGDNVATKK